MRINVTILIITLSFNALIDCRRGKLKEIRSFLDYETALESDKLTIINFTAKGCPPCKEIAPAFKALAKCADYENFNFCSCDVDKNPKFC